MNKLLLSCSISRAVRVKRPVTCYRFLNKSFSTTRCRKSETAATQRTEEEEPENDPPPPPAETEDNDINLRELLGNESFSSKLLLMLSVLSSFDFP